MPTAAALPIALHGASWQRMSFRSVWPQHRHRPWIPTLTQAAQIMGICVSFGGNTGLKHHLFFPWHFSFFSPFLYADIFFSTWEPKTIIQSRLLTYKDADCIRTMGLDMVPGTSPGTWFHHDPSWHCSSPKSAWPQGQHVTGAPKCPQVTAQPTGICPSCFFFF